MVRRISFNLLFLSLALFFLACRQGTGGTNTAAKPTPALGPATSVKFVHAEAYSVEIPTGGSAEAVVKLTIQNGYHVNANPPTFSYLRATEIVVPAAEGISVGFIKYPNALTKTFSFAEKPLAVYEGEASIKVMLKATPSATKGPRTLPAKLNIQACDDQLCYAPGVLDLSIPASIK